VKPEVFGLATLDTVTCALAGAIVLLIFMAALTERDAKLVMSTERQILQSGEEEPATPAARQASTDSQFPVDMENLVAVFFDVGAKRGVLPIVVGRGSGCSNTVLGARTLRSPSEHFTSDSFASPVGVTVWASGDPVECREFSLQVPGVGPVGCTVTLVSGAHFDSRQIRACNATMVFKSNGDRVYRFDREY